MSDNKKYDYREIILGPIFANNPIDRKSVV